MTNLILGNIVVLFVEEWMDLRFIAGFVVALLLLITLLIIRLSNLGPENRRDTPSQTPLHPPYDEEAPEASPNAWASSPSIRRQPKVSPITPDLDKLTDTAEMNPIQSTKPAHLTSIMVESLEAEQPEEAARLWGALGRWSDSARVFESNGQFLEAAKVWIGLDCRQRAIPLLRKAFQADPSDGVIRLLLVETLFNIGDMREADKLIQPLLLEDSPIKASGRFLHQVGRVYESMGDLVQARDYYLKAMKSETIEGDLEQRVNFLKHLQRLSAPYENGNIHSPASEFLDQALRDSRIAPIPGDLRSSSDSPSIDDVLSGKESSTGSARELVGHEIIVGHLAYGFTNIEPRHAFGSVFSLSRRFAINRIMKETEVVATFEATDRLLDYPVALKMVRLSPDTPNIDILRQRLQAIAQLNHPNLAKVTFVDREGPMLRIATEFLSGGNLGEFLTKIGGTGIPLLIRLSMYLASALYTAHMRGVPHGDIRPENILIGPDQRIKLIDFALSPIPVQRFDEELNTIGESTETPQMLELMAKNEGIQSDLYQFGDIIDFMLRNLRETQSYPPNMDPDFDPKGEMVEVANRLHNGQFSSVLRLWQVLEQIFQRAVPPKSGKATPQ